ncbi:MAG: hypothetical protein M1818_000162 [Claussenomyces sp. TS43310]|nr:MAG: hypothetical protein M1818_000162 [Claussenomyces sp. TS43310]
MPSVVDYRGATASAIQQIILSPSDTDFLDQLIPTIKDATASNHVVNLMQNLSQYADEREADIGRMCNTNHQEFLTSVNQLQKVREGTVKLTSEILKLNQSIQASTEKLAEHKKALVDSRGVRQNINETTEALKDCLEVLRVANHVHELLLQKNYYGALRALDELRNVHLKEVTQYKIAEIIQKSVPSTQKLVAEAVMTDLNTWLYRIRETSQFLGEVAFYHTELRRTRQKERMEADPYLRIFKLNSAVEMVFDKSEESDVLDNEELQVDFTPLFECLHIHDSLGQSDKFRGEYAATRRRQKELLLPNLISLAEDDSSLSSLLEGIAGFAIIERATMRRALNLRSPVDVDELWDSMCHAAISLISKALNEVENAEVLLKIKNVIALFIQTMDGWGYSVITLDSFLLTLFEKYAELLKRRFSDDFQEVIVSTDDYMPMPISNIDEYDKVVNFYFFADDHFQHPNIIDETLKKASHSLDELLSEKVCKSLIERLNSQYLGQIVQILINLEHFEIACQELEQLLIAARSSASAGGPIVLNATEQFRSNKKTAEKRIFELVNSKIDDLIETAEYDWYEHYDFPSQSIALICCDKRMAPTLETEPSNYMQTLTRYLSNIMNSTLLGLPREIKELIYFDALSHAANMILALPLSPDVRRINPNGVAALAKDVGYLTEFVDSLENAPILQGLLDELQQTVNLMQTDNPDEFFDIATRNKKFGRVDALQGPKILEKCIPISVHHDHN